MDQVVIEREGEAPEIDAQATARLADLCQDALARAPSAFEAAHRIALRLGAHWTGEIAEIGFWVPELLDLRVPDGDIFLEVIDPVAPLDLSVARQQVSFHRVRLPMKRVEAYAWAAVRGMRAGTKAQVGSFYTLTWRDADGCWRRVHDPLASSLPFGAFAPAELYDIAAIDANRTDGAHFRDLPCGEVAKIGPARNILQIHVGTATAGGTIASLTRQFEHLADRVRRQDPPAPQDRIFLGYDAVQLMPVEPTTVYEAGPDFWVETRKRGEGFDAELRRPDTTNWGYDVVIAGMAAVNPAILETGRPDELAELAAVLHTFPGGPKKLVFDVVYGHSDNQGLEVLNPHFFAGPNMYGQNINYRNPTVRAILLEMQRRKVNFGADAVRVDGAQDFQWWDAEAQVMRHDDAFLQQMADTVQEVAGRKYRPWFIFEDGRPWPEEDWELSSTYRAVIETQTDDDVFQWGPLTFAHNTPFLYTFWLSKYWRIREILTRGETWISGCANHDTLRRGTQINPNLNVNTRLGTTRMDILDKAYDNPAVNMLTYVAFPGVPMDFLNAGARASWGFIRNQDDRWAVKVVAEEVISLKWQVDDYAYSIPGSFRRLKEMGFETRESLARFLEFLPALVEVTGYDLDVIAKLLSEVDPPLDGPQPLTVTGLKQIARAWMDDMHDYCNVSKYHETLGDAQTAFNLAVREFRLARPWLQRNLGPDDKFDYVEPADGRVIFKALRTGPDGERVFMICHMEGSALEIADPLSLLPEDVPRDGWHVALRTPPIGSDYLGGPLTLHDSMGLTFTRAPAA